MYRFKHAPRRNPVVASSRAAVIKRGPSKKKQKVGSALERMVRLAATEERISDLKDKAAAAKSPAKVKEIKARIRAQEKMRLKLAGEFHSEGQRVVSPATAAKWAKSSKVKAKAAGRKAKKKVAAKRQAKVSVKASGLTRDQKSKIRSRLWAEAGRDAGVYRQLCAASGL